MSEEITLEKRIEDRIGWHRDSLAISCRSLSEHLVKVAEQLESDKPHENLTINDLGTIQARGTIIDAECGRLMGKIEVWSLMK